MANKLYKPLLIDSIEACPLIQALSKEYVILHYSDIEISKCGLFKR